MWVSSTWTLSAGPPTPTCSGQLLRSPTGRGGALLGSTQPSPGSPARDRILCFPFPQVHWHLFVLRRRPFPSSGSEEKPAPAPSDQGGHRGHMIPMQGPSHSPSLLAGQLGSIKVAQDTCGGPTFFSEGRGGQTGFVDGFWVLEGWPSFLAKRVLWRRQGSCWDGGAPEAGPRWPLCSGLPPPAAARSEPGAHGPRAECHLQPPAQVLPAELLSFLPSSTDVLAGLAISCAQRPSRGSLGLVGHARIPLLPSPPWGTLMCISMFLSSTRWGSLRVRAVPVHREPQVGDSTVGSRSSATACGD